MDEGDDLRARLEAQMAARREAGVVRRRAERNPVPVAIAEPPASTGVEAQSDASRSSRRRGAHTPPDTGRRRPRRPGGARRRRGSGWRLTVFAVVVVALAIGLRLYVVEPFYVPSGSMEPTLHGCSGCNDDRLLVDKLSYDLHGVRRGDVVVFRRPPGAPVTDAVLVKRVVGLAGESVSIHDGGVYIDGRRLSEPYVDRTCPGTVPETQPASLVVPRGDVYVMGDNRCNSTDSRTFGAIEKSSIIGRAFVIVWPLGRIHWL